MAPRARPLASVKALGWFGCAALAGSLLIASCSNDSSSSTPDEQDSNSSDDDEIVFDLKSVKGKLELSADANMYGCSSSTTSSVVELSAGDETTEAATFERETGHFSFNALLNAKQLPVEGSYTCGSNAQDCSGSSTPLALPTFVFVDSLLENIVPSVPGDAPSEFAFFANVALTTPGLCRGEDYAEQTQAFHLGPVSVAQLQGGRFSLSSKGSKPIHPKPVDPSNSDEELENATVAGTLSWDIELVLEASNGSATDVDPPSDENVVWYDQCEAGAQLGPENATDDTQQAIEDGVESVDLDVEGCHQRRVTVDGDTTIVELVHVTGTDLAFNKKTGLLESSPQEDVLYHSEFVPGGWSSVVYQAGDPIYETADEWDGAGDYAQGTAVEHQTQGAQERWTSTALDNATLTVVHETLQNGDVTSTEEWTQAAAQAQGAGSRAGDCASTVACPRGVDNLLKKLWNARNGQASKCLQRVAPDAAAKVASAVNAGNVKVVCGSSCAADASFTEKTERGFNIYLVDSLVQNITARDLAAVNGSRGDLSNASTAINDLAVTLFHESLHTLDTFSHSSEADLYLKNPANASFAHQYSRAYACEVTCFAPDKATACNCRRCAIPEGQNGKGRTCNECNNFPPADCTLYACSADNTLYTSAAACKTGCGSIACKKRSVPECLPSE